MIGFKEVLAFLFAILGLLTGLACGSHHGIFAALGLGVLGIVAGFLVGYIYAQGMFLLLEMIPQAKPGNFWWSVPAAFLWFTVYVGFFLAAVVGQLLLIKVSRFAG
jgi:hypothetical protein